MCRGELTESFTELTEFAVKLKLSEAQLVLFSETVLSKQYSAHFLTVGVSDGCFAFLLLGGGMKSLFQLGKRFFK